MNPIKFLDNYKSANDPLNTDTVLIVVKNTKWGTDLPLKKTNFNNYYEDMDGWGEKRRVDRFYYNSDGIFCILLYN